MKNVSVINMNFTSFRLSNNIVSVRSLRDIYLHRTTIFISDHVVKLLKDICNKLTHTTDLKTRRDDLIREMKSLQILQYVKEHYNCGESDDDRKIDDFYHELDIFINLEIRLIAHAAFSGFDRIPHYSSRDHYYQFLNHLYEVGKTIIISESDALNEFLMGRNRRLVQELMQTYRAEMVAFAPVPNKSERLYRAQALPHLESSTTLPPSSSSSSTSIAKPKMATPRVRFQPIIPPSTTGEMQHVTTSTQIRPPNTEMERQRFLAGGATYESAPSPLQKILKKKVVASSSSTTTVPPTSTHFKEIWLN